MACERMRKEKKKKEASQISPQNTCQVELNLHRHHRKTKSYLLKDSDAENYFKFAGFNDTADVKKTQTSS